MPRLSAKEEKRRRDCLERYYVSHGAKYCSELLGLPNETVRMWAVRCGFAKPKPARHRKTPEEIKWLTNNYAELGASVCAKTLNISEQALRQWARRRGLSRDLRLTDEQIKYLVENHAKLGPGKVAKALDRHPRTICNIAKSLGLPKLTLEVRRRLHSEAKKRKWTNDMDGLLRQHYPDKGGEYLAKELGIPVSHVMCRVRHLKLRRSKKAMRKIWREHGKRLKGRPVPESRKQKMREAANTPEHRAQARKAIAKACAVSAILNRGKKLSPEHRGKSIAALNKARAKLWQMDMKKLEEWSQEKLKETDECKS